MAVPGKQFLGSEAPKLQPVSVVALAVPCVTSSDTGAHSFARVQETF